MFIICFTLAFNIGLMFNFVHIQVKRTVHRPRFSCFDDPVTGVQTTPFPMVSGFFLDPMHLIDGGVLKDFMENIVTRLGSWAPGAIAKGPVLQSISRNISLFNKSIITELCAFRYARHSFHNIFLKP